MAHLWLYLARRLLQDEVPHRVPRRVVRLARQCAVMTIFVVFIFTLTSLNASFDLTFHREQDALRTTNVITMHDNGTITFGAPPEKWVWNATQLTLDNATLMLMNSAKKAFDAITWTVALALVAREASQNWSDAKQESEESRHTYGLLYIIGVRPGVIWPAYFVQKIVVYTAGLAVGSFVSVYLLLPFVLAQFQGTIGALFFQDFNYAVSFVAACLMCSMGMTIRSYVLARQTRHAALARTVHELA
jgi:hypothetical protein